MACCKLDLLSLAGKESRIEELLENLNLKRKGKEERVEERETLYKFCLPALPSVELS